MYTENLGWLLLTNDDGIEAPGFEMLVKALNKERIPIIIFAPSENHSAAGMRIQLGKPMGLRERRDLIELWGLDESAGLHMFELDGTPCDTMIVALDGGLDRVLPGIVPKMVLSGVNLGPNMSQDSYHSGTMGAAREAGLYGMPAIASSFTSFDIEGMDRAVSATIDLTKLALSILPDEPKNVRRPFVDISAPHISRWPEIPESHEWLDDPEGALMQAFRHGELMLNLNVPPTWDNGVMTTRLGMRWYRNAVVFEEAADGETAAFSIGAASIDHGQVKQGDCDAVLANKASISCLPVWPQSHPLALDDALLTYALKSGESGYPSWLLNS